MSRSQTSPPSFEQLLDRLRAAGFEVTPQEGHRARVAKGHCAAVLECTPESNVRFAERPGYVLGQYIARLEDRGFQKYLFTPQRHVPALAEHLRDVHDFSEGLKAALGLESLYNESLGTVSDRYLYDRLKGREGPGHSHQH
ncbi:MAG: hypothetical protein ACRD96_28865 [Bryobacteraceae bacterium]